MSTHFVEMYHPLLPSTATTPARVALSAVDEHEAQGWLLVDPDAPPSTTSTPYYSKAELLSQIEGGASPIGTALRAAFVPRWTASASVTAGLIVLAPDGKTIQRNADGTTRSSYDATEQALWTVVSSGGTTTTQAAGIAAGMALVFGG